MRLGVDVGIDAQADRRFFAQAGSDFVEPFEFGRGFDVEAEDAGFKGKAHFFDGFADTGEDDFFRVAACGQRTLQFAAGNDIEAGAASGKDVEQCQAGVGLDGIADERVDAFEFVQIFVQRGFQRGAGINIAGGAETSGNFG